MQLEFGGHRLTVAAGDFVIGSDAGAALFLTGAGVEPRHAVIHLLGDGLVAIQPASATASLAINGIRAGTDPTPLLHGDRVTIGAHEIRVVDPGRSGPTQVLWGLNVGTREDDPIGPGLEGAGPDWVGRLVSLNDGREYPLDSVPFVLGRDATAQVVIASPDSSRRHAEIVSRPDGDVVVDLSSNGTHVNGKPIPGRHRLKALDVIRIGAEEFRYYPPPRAEPLPSGAQFRLGDTLIGIPSMPKMPAGAKPRPARAKPLAVLLGKSGPMKGHRLEVMTPVANVGRGDYNDLKVNDPSVSASHAKLQLREGIWTLRDLGSTNGTTVDGSGISDDCPLSPGATVVFGEMAFSFEPRDEGIDLDRGTLVLEVPPILTRPSPARAAPIRPADGPPTPDPFAAAPRRASGPRPAIETAPPPEAGGRKTFLVIAVVVVLALLSAAVYFFGLRQ